MTTYYSAPYVFNATTTGAGNRFFSFGNTGIATSTTEALCQTKVFYAATVQKLRVYIDSNSRTDTTTIKTRINGSDGNCSVSISSGATGFFSDTSNTDTVSNGDLVCYQATSPDTTNNIGYAFIATDFKYTSAVMKLVSSVSTAQSLTTASVTRYGGFSLVAYQTTEAATFQGIIPAAGVCKNFSVYVNANSRTTSNTLNFRKNSANGNQSITISAGATGWFSDTSNTDSVSATDLINWSITTGTGTQAFSLGCITIDIENTTTGSVSFIAPPYNGRNIGSNTTNYFPFSTFSTAAVTSEDQKKLRMYGSGTIRNFYGYSGTNTASNSTSFYVRKNTTDQAVTFSIPSSTTGTFSDTSNSFTYAYGDDLVIKGTRATGTGTCTINSFSLEMVVDGESGGNTYNETISASMTSGYSLAVAGTFNNTFSDSIISGYSLTNTMTMNNSFSSSITSDYSLSVGNVISTAISETSSMASIYSVAVVFNETVSETVTTLDNMAASLIISSSISENIAADFSITNDVTFNVSMLSTSSLSDSIDAQAVFNATITNAANMIFNATGGNIFDVSISETIIADDSLISSITFNVPVGFSASMADEMTATAVFNAAMSAAITADASFENAMIINASISATAAMASSFTGYIPNPLANVILVCYILDKAKLDTYIQDQINLDTYIEE